MADESGARTFIRHWRIELPGSATQRVAAPIKMLRLTHTRLDGDLSFRSVPNQVRYFGIELGDAEALGDAAGLALGLGAVAGANRSFSLPASCSAKIAATLFE
jgi:hypothetical protein